MELLSKKTVYEFEHDDLKYTRTSYGDGEFQWSNNDRVDKLQRLLNNKTGFVKHVKPKSVKKKSKTMTSPELEKLYIQFVRELKLERILKNDKQDL